MKTYQFVVAALFVLTGSCKYNTGTREEVPKLEVVHHLEVQGHRGERGNLPENSIPGFIGAVKKGVDVLELDLVISRDKKVVVSHEPYMSSDFMLMPSGDSISKEAERSYNLYKMTYDSIRQFDAGSKGNPLFPGQKKIKTYKPLLGEVIDSVEAFVENGGLPPVKYNVEIKSVVSEYGHYQPEPEEFVNLVMNIIRKKAIEDKVVVQSFDPEVLRVMKRQYPGIQLSYLVSSEGIEENLSLLNFLPEIYSPRYTLVNRAFVDSIHNRNMRLIPWTVNEKEDIRNLIHLEVDGIITDYPERVLEELSEMKK